MERKCQNPHPENRRDAAPREKQNRDGKGTQELSDCHPPVPCAAIELCYSFARGGGMEEQPERLPWVSCREACIPCKIGHHEECEDPDECECTHLKEMPKGWLARLREKFPL